MNQVVGLLVGLVLGPAMVGEPLLAGSGEAVPAGFSDGFSTAFVLVVWGDAADGLVEADAVVGRLLTRRSAT